jgi:hypothetical protein
MDPATLAMMYAMNVGIEALQGKRGSNLWKDAFKDTTTQALTMQFTGGLDKGAKVPPVGSNDLMLKNVADKGITQTDNITKTLTEGGKKLTEQEKIIEQLPFLEKGAKTYSTTKPPAEGIGGWFDKAAGVFKSEKPVMTAEGQQFKLVRDAQGAVRSVPVTTAQTDRLKVGLGGGALGAGLYAAGAFDPVDPPEPKYPGYNKFYAENPGQFMPYDDPNIDPIDYSKYPDKPYSGIKQGGIIGLQAGGPPFNVDLYNQLIAQGVDPDSAFQQAGGSAQMDSVFGTDQKNKGGIAAFAQGGRASNQPNQSIVEATSEEESRRLRQLGIPHQDPGLTPEEVIPRGGPRQGSPRIPYEREEDGSNGGIGGYGPGRKVLPEGHFSPTPQIDPRWFHPDNPRFLRPDVQGVKTGALIHRLPSKTKVDEDNPKNYKRTSGKLVVDKAGKGSENKDTMLAQLADGEFVTKSKAVRGAGLALGANPKDKKQQKDLGARYFYKQMAEFDKLAKQMAS